MRVLIGMQNILDESDERCGTPARTLARMNPRLHLLLCCRHCRGGSAGSPSGPTIICSHGEPSSPLPSSRSRSLSLKMPMMRADAFRFLAHNC
jgi:hypothetical protein